MLPVLYREGGHTMSRKFLSEPVYAEAIGALVIDCTDAVIVDWGERVFYLAKRAVKPMKGIWVIGGRRSAGEPLPDSMCRCFKRETGLDLPRGRFTYIAGQDCIWKDREQEPQDAGSHNFCHRFAVELTSEERGRATRPFSRKDLVAANVHQSLIDLYHLVFGPAA